MLSTNRRYSAVTMILVTMVAGLSVWPASYAVGAEASSLHLRAKAQGVGWLTCEEVLFNAKGQLLTHSPDTYKIPALGDTPEQFHVALLERAPQDNTIHGSKAVGEPPFMLAIGVVTALRHAIAGFGPKGTEVDVVLCDLMMPDLTGMELHADLVTSAPAVASRMVFVTGGAFTPAARTFMDTVKNARVDKPFDPQLLREQVRDWVAKARSGGPGQAA